MRPYQIRLKNQEKLPVIHTARGEKAINKGAAAGFWPLIRLVYDSHIFKNKYAVSQHPETGAIEVQHDFRARISPGYEQVIYFTDFYPTFHNNHEVAAYLIPKDLAPGTRVWLADLIEDVIGARWNQGSVYRLASMGAVWTGNTIQLDPPQEYQSERVG